MKFKVNYGKTGVLTTVLVSFMLIGSIVWLFVQGFDVVAWSFVGIVALCFLSALFYAPVSVELTDSSLIVHRPIASKIIPLANIRSVHLHYPKCAIRTCGASGFFGNWGLFSERGIGSYFAYFGIPSECFLVKLDTGRKYLLGCTGASAIVDAINSELAAR